MNDSSSAADVLLGDDNNDENREEALDGANLKDPDTGIATSPVTRNHKVKQVSMAIGKLAESQETAGTKLTLAIDKLGDAIINQTTDNKKFDELEKQIDSINSKMETKFKQ
jgi:hypothetical protein